MAVGKKVSESLLIGFVLGAILFFSFRVWLAGCARQARFNTMVLYQVAVKYRQANGVYPKSFSELKRFYIVSAADRLYCDWKSFKDGRSNGYVYGFSGAGDGRFVLSASPARFQFFLPEFGIGGDGRLRIHSQKADTGADNASEVRGWPEIKNHLFLYSFGGQ